MGKNRDGTFSTESARSGHQKLLQPAKLQFNNLRDDFLSGRLQSE